MKSIESMKHQMALNVTDSMIYGNWTFIVINVVLLPTWLSFWSLLNAPIEKIEKRKAILN